MCVAKANRLVIMSGVNAIFEYLALCDHGFSLSGSLQCARKTSHARFGATGCPVPLFTVAALRDVAALHGLRASGDGRNLLATWGPKRLKMHVENAWRQMVDW